MPTAHRLAPEVGARIAALEAEGRLRLIAGALLRAEEEGAGAHVTWRPRGTDGEENLHVGLIVSSIWPEGDLTRTSDPLVRD